MINDFGEPAFDFSLLGNNYRGWGISILAACDQIFK